MTLWARWITFGAAQMWTHRGWRFTAILWAESLVFLPPEHNSGIRAVVAAAPAAQNWAGGTDLRDALRRAARNARVPIFFFQAANDFDLAPTEQLALEMTQVGKSHMRKIYPAWGTSVGQGHNFAVSAPQVWGPDVFGFLADNLRPR
jgi:hypothetical protein